MPQSFSERDLFLNSEENEFIFLMTGLITQNKNTVEEKCFFISDYLRDPTNNSWYLIKSKSFFEKFTWVNMWKSISRNNHYPIVLLFTKYSLISLVISYNL